MSYRLDAELAAALPSLPSLDVSDVAWARAELGRLRAQRPAAPPPETSDLAISEHCVKHATNRDGVTVRMYRPRATSALPALLYIHGGGFVLGGIDDEQEPAAALARAADSAVLAIEYRLAPEWPFPAGIDDCYAVLEWVAARAESLGLGGDRIAVLGQSSGGALAAGLALMARDRNGPRLCFQALDVPALDDRLQTASMRAFVDTPLWDRGRASVSWRHYLGESDQSVSPYAAPARATDLSGLPPAYISTMEFDPLRDEGLEFGMRLLRAGVSAELHSFPGTFHGAALVPGAALARRIREEQVVVLRRALRG